MRFWEGAGAGSFYSLPLGSPLGSSLRVLPEGFRGSPSFNGTACYGEVCSTLLVPVHASVFAPGGVLFSEIFARNSN